MKEYVFHVSGYDNSLADEVEKTLRAETERKSRQSLPKMWSVTDKMNTLREESGGKAKPKTSGFLLTLFFIGVGLFVFIPGTKQANRVNAMTIIGAICLLIGVIRLLPKSAKLQDQKFKNGAQALLQNLNRTDFSEQPKVTVNNAGVCISAASGERTIAFDQIDAAYETASLWAFISNGTVTMVQKKDLPDEEHSEFTKYLRKSLRNKFEVLEK